MKFGSGYPVKLVNSDGTVVLPEVQANAVKLGHYIQVFGSYVSNTTDIKPGMYLNHAAVSYQGIGEEIHLGIDTKAVGFGTGAKPPGMGAVPTGGMSAAQAGAAAGGAPPLPSAAPPIPTGAPAIPTGAPPLPGAAAPTAVVPSAPFVGGAAAPPPPPAAPAPPAADPVTTTGIPFQSYIAQGWTIAQMKAQGVIA